jgi:2'-5' RNA ligase
MIRELAQQFHRFEIQLGDVQVFPVSDVIHVSVAQGTEQLRQMHDTMNIDGLRVDEPFSYSPHVTLAQDLHSDEVDELTRVARSRWAECSFPTRFRAEKIVFVQNTRRNEWQDLGECLLDEDDAKSRELTDLLAG